ncbi:hypothetical protein GGX14DRAFT_671460 [Mycena pura]|uniref:Uncharacterized protein n=1 Tax=Mycena pura TaxID=153505 RepID=A0AAD6UXN7_9AGAR|nr:hypothetical protein GGX14DRAFT_671460 [Mycena pura]
MHAAHLSTPSKTAAEDEPQAGQAQGKEEQALARLEAFHDAMHGMAPGDAAGCLRISYAIIYEIITYVARHGDDSAAYLSVFMNSEAPADSTIGRARKSVFCLARLVVSVLSSVPASSPLWIRNQQIFALLGALEHGLMVYDGPDTGDTQQWTQFWDRTQPILLELGSQLDQAGFGAE